MNLAQRETACIGSLVKPISVVALRRRVGRALLYMIALLVTVFFLGPFLWTVSSSLKTSVEVRQFPPSLLPATPHFENYATVFQVVPFGQFLGNSIIVTTLAVLGQTISATLVAYGFARFRFPLRNALFVLVLATLLLPREVTWIPLFLLYKRLGWLDTLKPLIVPSFFGGGAFFIFLLRQFFLTLPKDLDEAAKMDGANSLQVLVRVLLPLSRPALATAAIFSFLGHWNDFLEPLIFINNSKKFTIALGLRYFQTLPNESQEPRDHLLMAASLIVLAPCLFIFFNAQRSFVKGIVMSGIKG
jgi:ABC-type glycerol-3-phosphate transport system permease component